MTAQDDDQRARAAAFRSAMRSERIYAETGIRYGTVCAWCQKTLDPELVGRPYVRGVGAALCGTCRERALVEVGDTEGAIDQREAESSAIAARTDENVYERMVRQAKGLAMLPCEFKGEPCNVGCATCYARETVKLLEKEAAEASSETWGVWCTPLTRSGLRAIWLNEAGVPNRYTEAGARALVSTLNLVNSRGHSSLYRYEAKRVAEEELAKEKEPRRKVVEGARERIAKLARELDVHMFDASMAETAGDVMLAMEKAAPLAKQIEKLISDILHDSLVEQGR